MVGKSTRKRQDKHADEVDKDYQSRKRFRILESSSFHWERLCIMCNEPGNAEIRNLFFQFLCAQKDLETSTTKLLVSWVKKTLSLWLSVPVVYMGKNADLWFMLVQTFLENSSQFLLLSVEVSQHTNGRYCVVWSKTWRGLYDILNWSCWFQTRKPVLIKVITCWVEW